MSSKLDVMKGARPRKRQSSGPPLRLPWPGGGEALGHAPILQTCLSQSSGSSVGCLRNSGRKLSQHGSKSKRLKSDARASRVGECSSMWVDKHAPTIVKNLCVAPKKVKEVRSWIEASLNRSNVSEEARLLVLIGSPGVGKSTMVRVLAAEIGLEVHGWSDSQTNKPLRERSNELLSVDNQSAINAFEMFLQSAGAGYQSLMHSGKEENRGRGLILLEELPNLYSAESESRFRHVMGDHIKSSQVPTVMVFSDVCEGKHKPEELERLVPVEQLYSSKVKILQLNAVTKQKMKKCLQEIVKEESVNVPDGFWEGIHCESRGDLRHAIMALQFQYGSKIANDRQTACKRGGTFTDSRDTKLSTFHALGKLLYAKRKPHSSLADSVQPGANLHFENRAPLDFDPELVMEHADVDVSAALTFLEYHSPDFFSDVSELCQAFGNFSEAAMFVDKTIGRDRGDSCYPRGYVASIAGRAIANANRHPTPHKFRSLGAPKSFEVLRKRRGNDATLKQLRRRLCLASHHVSIQTNIASTRSFVVNDLPYMRTIMSDYIDSAVNSLHSIIQPFESSVIQNGIDETLQQALHDQKQILADDDIIDDSSVEEGVPSRIGQTHHSKVDAITSTAAVESAASLKRPDVIVIDD